jgi:hypothetical protein
VTSRRAVSMCSATQSWATPSRTTRSRASPCTASASGAQSVQPGAGRMRKLSDAPSGNTQATSIG